MGTNINVDFRLEEKLKEGRDVSTVLGMVSKEKENLERENTRLNHRIFYLEEQVGVLQSKITFRISAPNIVPYASMSDARH